MMVQLFSFLEKRVGGQVEILIRFRTSYLISYEPKEVLNLIHIWLSKLTQVFQMIRI
jgi:hypothetical protein